ncbi:hypothetical protein [Amycolatopsis sp.]|uniref:hypothetical protein n=1 Tax=Amycolatopsis sp. TaxID=37632 RepID=UPI002C67C2EA|nr:hypothetical protein [Amycolatopsis sp.]HVV13237.1 hypothetical protein [Amycolatopsis sp.]
MQLLASRRARNWTVVVAVGLGFAGLRIAGSRSFFGEILFRPPNGKKLFALPRYLAARNRKTITWDVEPNPIRWWTPAPRPP